MRSFDDNDHLSDDFDSDLDSMKRAMPAPLPTELPPLPDLSSLPLPILHSGTVETLLGQIEDLMARLKVNIRRNSVLEQQIMEQERLNSELMRANSSTIAQLQVHEEKELIARERFNRIESKENTLRAEIDMLRGRMQALELRNQELRASDRFRRRVQRWVRPMIEQLHAKLASERKAFFAKEAQVSDLRARLAETASMLQSQAAQFSKDQARLVEQYEAVNHRQSSELEKLRVECKSLAEKAARLDHATSAEAMAKNRIVFLERQAEALERDVASYRTQAKTLAAEARTRDEELTELRQAKLDARENLARAQDQLESLQAVWAEAQKKLEASRLQQETLNRLNQELSRQLKEQRLKENTEPRPRPEVSN